jgi:glycosyltransferase involved in cell wall biosynthesis
MNGEFAEMKDGDLISIIIPVYNCEQYVAEAIESVLAQTYCPIEVIVVDDGSTDGSADVIKHFDSSVRYIFQQRGGLGAALNKGIEEVHGNYIAFLDSDDLWAREKLSRQKVILDNDKNVDMVFGHVRGFISPELSREEREGLSHPEGAVAGYCKGAMLIRRESFFRIGLFSTQWHVGDFIDWYSRAVEQGLKSSLTPEVVLYRRIHSANQGIRERIHQKDYVHILKKALDRRRKGDT